MDLLSIVIQGILHGLSGSEFLFNDSTAKRRSQPKTQAWVHGLQETYNSDALRLKVPVMIILRLSELARERKKVSASDVT